MSLYPQKALFLSLAIAVLFTILPSSTADTQLIISTCKKASGKDYEPCMKLLQSDPSSATASTLDELARISIELVRKRFIGTHQQVIALSRSRKFDKWVIDGLKTCADMYSSAESDLGDALAAFMKKDYDTVKTMASSASDSPDDCEDCFFEKEGETSPITRVNQEMDRLSLIVLGIANLFH